MRHSTRAALAGCAAFALAACGVVPHHERAKPRAAAHAPGEPAAKAAAPARAKPAEERNRLPASEVGYYLDVLQGRLTQSVDPGVIIGRDGDGIVLDLSRRVTFADDGTQLDAAGRATLAQIANVLIEYSATQVTVSVGVDDGAASALALAAQRARAVARCLGEEGISDSRIAVAAPMIAGRARWPRIELRLVAFVRSTPATP